jgi:hypothetical protein
MYICITHVDAITGIPCDVAPMSHGPAFPKITGFQYVWANESEWPTNKPLFYGVCDDDADISISGVLAILTEEQYLLLNTNEVEARANKLRNLRDFKLSSEIDTLNPIRWGALTTEEQTIYTVYRQELLDLPQQSNFPWSVTWPERPE